jgi:hypothetical protein
MADTVLDRARRLDRDITPYVPGITLQSAAHRAR